MATITEIAPDLFRVTTVVEPFNIQFSQFLVRDDEPLLFQIPNGVTHRSKSQLTMNSHNSYDCSLAPWLDSAVSEPPGTPHLSQLKTMDSNSCDT